MRQRLNRDGTMQRRKMSRKTGRVKRAGAAGMLLAPIALGAMGGEGEDRRVKSG